MRTDPLAFAVLLPTLMAAHDIADHVVQTDYRATEKASSWRAMAGHVSGYQLTQAAAVGAVCARLGLRPSPVAVAVGWLLSGATHAVIDRRWPVRRVLRATRSPQFADMRTPLHGMYLADQALHHAALAVCAAVMATRRGRR